MRNLKKVLSLVLAVAMMVSICVVGAGAVNYDDFTDKNQITKTQAVETLVSLDVIKGYDNGATFNPTGNVTRAEMATMICRVLAGGDNMIVDATKAVPTYTDVPNTHWAVTYVEYCTSLGIVSGKSPTSFDPDANVTAAEAAKMVMTALGYNADIEGFKGNGWDINSMAKANTLKLLTNLENEVSASKALTREQVAQLLFNALTTPMVQYYEGTVANIWIGAGNTNNKYYETLLETKFNAEKVVGVVVANEYADLDDTEPLAKGKTRMIVLGTDNEPTKQEMTFNVSTTLDDIGMSVIVYRDKSSNRVIFGNTQDTGMNVVTEFTAETKDITKGDNAVDKSAKDAEQYINYGNGVTTTYTARRVFSYTYTGTEGQESETVDKGETISADLFRALAYVYDAVNTGKTNKVVTKIDQGTNKIVLTNGENENYANFEEWAETYINESSKKTASLDALKNENGNYIKVIDYNNDGDIDYVLKTIYTATDVAKVSKKGTITLSTEDKVMTGNDAVNMLSDKTDVVCDDELAEGDIVVYAVIDGTAYTYLCDMTSAKIDKVNRNKLTCTTEDGDEYTQSGVNGAEYIDNKYFDDGVRNLAGKTSYDLYFDRYGYLVAFTETATSGDFTLLVDGWFMSQRTKDEYAVKAYIDGEIVDTDVTKGGSQFINENRNNNWGQLKQFGDLNYTGDEGIWTTVASLSEDGELTPVGEVYNKKTIEMIDTGKDIVDRAGVTGTIWKSNAKGDAYTETTTEAEVRALSTTVYYYVYKDGKNFTVKEYVGYGSLPKLTADDKAHIEDVYAVATEVSRSTTLNNNIYYTANVVVVEFDRAYRTNTEQVFVYDSPEVGKNVKIETLDIIRADGSMASVEVDLSKSDYDYNRDYDPAYGKLVTPGLYYLWETNEEDLYTIERMTTAEIAKEKYSVGYVRTSTYTNDSDWTELATCHVDFDNLVMIDGKTPEYKNVADSSYYNLSYVDRGYYKDNAGNIHYHDYDAKLDKEDDDMDVLDEKVTEQKAEFLNTVLVAYNKNDEIVYAVSFAHSDGKVDGVVEENNYAQLVWKGLLPETEAPVITGAPVVTFYGEQDTNGDKSITVSYKTAKDHGDDKALDVEGGEYTVTPDIALSTDKKDYTLTIYGNDGKFYTYTLTQSAASTDNAIKDGDALAIPEKDWSIKDFVEHYAPNDENATADYRFTTNSGKTFTVTYAGGEFDYTEVPANTTTGEVARVDIYVTAEDGKTGASYNAVANEDVVNYVTEWDEIVAMVNWTMKYGDVNGDCKLLDKVRNEVTAGYSDINAAAAKGEAEAEAAYNAAVANLKKAVIKVLNDRVAELLGGKAPSYTDEAPSFNNWCGTLSTRYNDYATAMADATLDTMKDIYNTAAEGIMRHVNYVTNNGTNGFGEHAD